jgi:hypothetical protein
MGRKYTSRLCYPSAVAGFFRTFAAPKDLDNSHIGTVRLFRKCLSSLFAPPKSNQKVSNALPPQPHAPGLASSAISHVARRRSTFRSKRKQELPRHPPGRWIHAPPNGKNFFVRPTVANPAQAFTAHLSAARESVQHRGFQLPTPRFVRRVTGCRGLREPDKVP